MRRYIILFVCSMGFALTQVPSLVCAQSSGPAWWTNLPPILRTNLPPDWTNQPPAWTDKPPVLTNLPPAWTNILRGLHGHSPWGTNIWWTNTSGFTNLPPARGKGKTHGVIPHGKDGASDLPKDVKTLVQQFQQESKQLMNSLQGANDAQRQQVLQQLSQLRDQLQDQLRDMTQQARDQAQNMRSRFGGNFGPGNAQGGPTTSGHGKPRP